MTREDRLQAVAEAIRNAVANRNGRGRPWAALPPVLRAGYIREAEAAIEAWERTE